MITKINTLPVVLLLGGLTAVAATVLATIFILPAEKRKQLPKFLRRLHDFLNMKELILEKILRGLYVLATIACVAVGVFLLFGFQVFEHFDYYGFSYTTGNWYGGQGLLLIFAGPIAVRIAFEISMLFVLLVRNTMEINQKLSGPSIEEDEEQEEAAEEPVVEEKVTPQVGYWTCVCGKVNAAYVGTCGCGCTRDVAQEESKRQAAIQAEADEKEAAEARQIAMDNAGPTQNGWRCFCGAENPNYVGTCACGVSKRDVLNR